MQPTTKKLYRSQTDKVIAGVCGGLGEYFEIDSLIFRILFLVLLFGGGSGLLVYIILALILPQAPQGPANPEAGKTNPTQNFADTVRQNAQDFAQDVKQSVQNRGGVGNARNILGIVIVVIGVLILLNQLLPSFWFPWHIFWPLMIIFVGILIITRKR